MSVAVVVNYQTDKEGKEAALSTEKINQITSLVKQAMGYSEARGDTVNVVNTPFTAHEFTDDYLPWWQQPQWISLATQTLRWLVVLIIAFILYRKIVSPALRHVKETLNPAPIEIPQETSTVDPSLNEAARKAQLRINAEQMSQRIRTMSENEPQVVALVIRDWMEANYENDWHRLQCNINDDSG